MLEKRASKGRHVPALDDRPEIFEDLIPAWNAWNDLHRRRSFTFTGPQPFSVTDVVSWLDLHHYTGEDKIDMFEDISFIDTVWIEWARKEIEKNNEKKKSKEKGNANTTSRNKFKARNPRR